MNMIVMFGPWHFDSQLCIFLYASVSQTTAFYISSTLFFFCNALQPQGNNGACRGPSIRVRGSDRPKPDVALKKLIMFVLFTNAALNRFLIFWTFFSFPSPWIYTHRTFVLTYAANKEHLVLSYKRLCLLESVARGAGLP